MSAARTAVALALALVSMAHVGSPDTFFSGKAGPYDVRVSVRLPGVIPGRAQVTVRIAGATSTAQHRVSIMAGQWNVGFKGAPPPERATSVPGDSALFAADLWFMTSSSYQMAVDVQGPSGAGRAIVPVLAIATAERTMPPWLGAVLVALGGLLTIGFLTLIGAAVRESVVPPGHDPDSTRRRRARYGIAAAFVLSGLMLWGGYAWWEVEARAYREVVRYRPFVAEATTRRTSDRDVLTLSIRDPRWTGAPAPTNRFNALMPDHGKLMHLFLVRENGLDAFAHLHPVARPQALDFDATLPPLPSGRYRVYGDIVHESGYAQTLVASVDVTEYRDTFTEAATVARRASTSAKATADRSVPKEAQAYRASDEDDSWFGGHGAGDAATDVALPDGSRLVWERGAMPFVAGMEQLLSFALRDASGTVLDVEPYLGMAAHVIVASSDLSVFAHLHPSGSISMAALQKFTATGSGLDSHASHAMAPQSSAIQIPYAFPSAGTYRVWIQLRRSGLVHTAAFDVRVQ
jgi:hypothetical protein